MKLPLENILGGFAPLILLVGLPLFGFNEDVFFTLLPISMSFLGVGLFIMIIKNVKSSKGEKK